MIRRLSTAPTSLKSSYHLKHLLILYWRPRYGKRAEHIYLGIWSLGCTSRAIDRCLKNPENLDIVWENYTEVIQGHLNRLNTLNFFVNKYFHSGVLTYLWERDVMPMILCRGGPTNSC